MQIVMAGAGNPFPFLRLTGGLKQTFSKLWRDNTVIFPLEEEYRRPNFADLGNGVVTVLDQGTGRNEGIVGRGGIAQRRKGRLQDNNPDRRPGRLFHGQLDGDAGAKGFPIQSMPMVAATSFMWNL